MSGRILMVDDDARLARMVADYLDGAGYRVSVAGTATEGLALLEREPFAALVLDLMLPDADGLEVCRRVRATSGVPILMLTARGDAADRVVGLEMGADDYLPKPFEPRELLARLRAILRRGASRGVGDVLRFGRLEIDRGPGIPEDERERIFEPFYGPHGTREGAGGYGLGLSLVRQIARRHGGDADCRARNGGGSAFSVRLPAA
jgi:CheY-like chemotaxis protein